MITFTSLLAKLHTDSNSNNPNENVITINNLREHIPQSFIVLHDLIKFFLELETLEQDDEEDAYKLMYWMVSDEILAVINAIDTFALNEQLSYRGGLKYKDNDEGLFARDPYVYFYEEFLQKFDKKERQVSGAYYTPPPVVKYIISGINEILRDNFDIHAGLADERVTLLDFAVGTGTFLVEIFKQIFDELKESNTSQAQIDNKIRQHILQNFFGFEYMIAPFTISYLKLTRMIEDYGFKFTKQDCPKIYITNTLEETKDPANLFNLKGIEKHIRETMNVKTTKKILVITGNPPYLQSEKTTEHIKKNIEIKKYHPLSEEKNKQPLCNAYIKFIRFAHKRIEESGLDKGIIGIITPHSYLVGMVHRGMRNELLKTFSEIYILDLHGAMGIDDNVFGDKKANHIKQAVCIAFFVKNKKAEGKSADVFYKSTLNWTRIEKYRFLWNNSIKNSGFEKLDVASFHSEFEKTKWAKKPL